MTKRIQMSTITKWLIGLGITAIPVSIGLFFYLSSIGAIVITGYSGSTICAGNQIDPCVAYVNFTTKEDIFIYPGGNWSKSLFYTDKPAEAKIYRSWGNSWREIKLNKTCTGTWCGAPNSNVAYSFAFRNNTNYQIKFVVLKNNPNETVKWGFDKIDPNFVGLNETVKTIYEQKGIDKNNFMMAEPTKYPVISINALDVKIAEYKITRIDDDIINWAMEGKAILHLEGNLFDGASFNLGNKSNYRYLILKTEKFKENITDYRKACVNKTIVNGTYEECSDFVTGSHIEEKEKTYWEYYNLTGMKAGNYTWRIEGIREINVPLDVRPEAQGKVFTEWAWYNASWGYKQQINFTGDGSRGAYVLVNLTDKILANGIDLRFLNSSDSGLIGHFVSFSNATTLGVWLNITNNDTVYMYYSNTTFAANISDSANVDAALYRKMTIYWKFNEASGNAFDSKSNFTLVNQTFALYVPGQLNNAVNITDLPTYFTATLNSTTTVGTGPYTFRVIMRMNRYVTQNGITWGQFGGSSRVTSTFEFYIGDAGGGRLNKFMINNPGVGQSIMTTTTINDSVNRIITISRRGTGVNQTVIYINGENDTVGTEATNWATTGSGVFKFGWGYGSDKFNGTIDDIQFYNGYGVTQAESLLDYNLTSRGIEYNLPSYSFGAEQAQPTPAVSIDYIVALPNGVIRFLNCSPDWEYFSQPDGQTSIISAINATNNGTATGIFTINLTGTPATGWTLFASNDSLVNNITLSTTAQTIWSGVTEGQTKGIWLAANCSEISSNPQVSIDMQAV